MPDLPSPTRRPPTRQTGALSRGASPIAVLGPTNTGKTHYALERMLAHGSGMIGLPLRLLAREVYDRIVEKRGARAVALVTGEEKIIPPSPRYWVCTVEAMPLDTEVDFMAIDEIQLAADLERGRIFTSRLLHARGASETLFLGSDTMRPLLRNLFPNIQIIARERLSVLSYSGQKKVTRLPRRSAIVGFSGDTVYAIAELIRRQRGGAAVILGALSPRTRNAQAALYQSGDVDFLVATDAIGMGLNMDIDHVAFAARRKFDGRQRRDLRHDEMAQIAGRAGRYMRDGTFGVTADCPAFDEEAVRAIEDHRFDPAPALQWRTEALDFSSLHALNHALQKRPPRRELHRARPGDDELALARLTAMDDVAAYARGGAALALLWEICQIPDFRKSAPDNHARLLADLYLQLARDERIASDWLRPRIMRLERTDGDIDAISARIAHIRTWTYLSHRSAWIEDAAYWQEKARSIEDSLSDALHEKLTQRFVDRRTSVLLKRLKDDAPLLAGVTEDGEVIVEGQFVGRLLGFEFIIDPRARGVEAKNVRAAADRALGPVLAARAAALANAAPGELSLHDDGAIWWRSSPVAMLSKGPAPLRPNVSVNGLDALSPHLRGRIQDRLNEFLATRVEASLGELIALGRKIDAGEDGGLGGVARGVGFRLLENFGAMSRAQFGDELKQLGQEERAKLRKLGVRFGEYTLFMPNLLKPAPARLLTLLWAMWADRDPAAFPPPKAGLVSLPTDKDLPHAYYYAAGYRPSGVRAVRIDMLERLAGQIRSDRTLSKQHGGFEASQQMMSLVGCSGEDFDAILGSLGYRKHTVKVAAPAPAPEGARNESSPDATPTEQPTEAAQTEAAPVATAPAASTAEAAQPAPNNAEAASAAPIPAATEPAPLESESDAAAHASEAESSADESPPAEESAASQPAASEREIIVWRQAPRRAPNRKRQRPDREAKKSAPAIGRRDGKPRDGMRDGQPAGKARRDKKQHGQDRGNAKPGQGNRGPKNAPRPHSIAPQHRRTADPDSPFAILAGLKDEMSQKKSASPAAKKTETAN